MKIKISDRTEFVDLRDVLIHTIHAHEKKFLTPKPYLEGSQIDWVVKRLALRPLMALARVWVVRKSYTCYKCVRQQTCDPQGVCLILVASYGNSISDHYYDYRNIYHSASRRLPLYDHVLGHLDPDFQHLHIVDVEKENQWMSDPLWARREGILGYVGMPIHDQDRLVGMLALFTRFRLTREGLVHLRQATGYAAQVKTDSVNLGFVETIRKLKLENIYLREELDDAYDSGEIIGKSPAHQRLMQQIDLVAQTNATVLISGESGTGKELVAKEIHRRSVRHARSLIKVNCAAIPRGLFESEFFGHAKGAFTGAVKDRAGRYEAADKGTLFLDEVGEIPQALQGKLLRLIQEGEYERVGEELTRQADVRIIAATNRDLKKDVENKKFRNDLYYRLNVFPIEVPPLRSRKDDIAMLAAHFLKRSAKQLNCPVPKLTRADLSRLKAYHWPGNIRELQNIIERAAIVSHTGRVGFQVPDVHASEQFDLPVAAPDQEPSENIPILTDAQMKKRDRDNMLAALQRCAWKIYGPDGAAQLLQMKPTTLASRIRKFGLAPQNRLET